MTRRPYRRLWLILAYMAFIFCLVLGLQSYARHHPLEDIRSPSAPQENQQE